MNSGAPGNHPNNGAGSDAGNESRHRNYRIVTLPGDHVGPEVYRSAQAALEVLSRRFGFDVELEEHLDGGVAFDETGDPLPEETLEACRQADAVLLGAVGGPEWDGNPREKRPERGLLRLRSGLGLYCNLRPIATHPALHRFSPIKAEKLVNVDVMIVRELTSGVYFGDKRRDGDVAEDVCRYTREEIARVTRKAGRLARQRQCHITQVDKANVLETSRLWREVTAEVIADEFPGVTLEHMFVDAASMHLLGRPGSFDVVLTENLFGDILSDEASMLCGSMGLLPSASLADGKFGLYEPVHGSAPDISGKGIANPYAMLLSVALMLRHSLDEEPAALALEQAVADCWEAGILTRDLVGDGVGTTAVTTAVCDRLAEVPAPAEARPTETR